MLLFFFFVSFLIGVLACKEMMDTTTTNAPPRFDRSTTGGTDGTKSLSTSTPNYSLGNDKNISSCHIVRIMRKTSISAAALFAALLMTGSLMAQPSLPNLFPFPNASGILETYNTSGNGN